MTRLRRVARQSPRSHRRRRPGPCHARPSRCQPSAHSQVVPVGANDKGQWDRLASHDDRLASRNGVAARDLVELRDLCLESAPSTVRDWSRCPQRIQLLPAERFLRGPLQQALADDEEIRMRGSEGRIVNLGAPLPSFVVGDFRQLPPRADQPFGESCLVENPERARMDREGVAVLVVRWRMSTISTRTPCCCRNRVATTDRTGADDENLRIGVTKHRASSPCVCQNTPRANPCSPAARGSCRWSPSRTRTSACPAACRGSPPCNATALPDRRTPAGSPSRNATTKS